jgi:hypothetical protein
VLDRGLSPFGLESLLITAGEHIDLIKLGWGTAYVSGAVADKVAICRDTGIALCPGGTLLEVAVAQDKVDEYVDLAARAGHRPRRGLQRLAADGAGAQGGADRTARRRVHGDLRGRLQERETRSRARGATRCCATSRRAPCW